MCNLENSVPIGLSLMVVISESFLQRLEDRAMQEALVTNLACSRIKDMLMTATQVSKLHQSHSFLIILNKQNKAIKYTMEKEDHSQKLSFLDVTVINTGLGKYEFKIHRKNAITYVQIKPHLFVNPALISGILNRFVSRAKKSCSGKYLHEELNFLVDMFVENEHDRYYLFSIIREINIKHPKLKAQTATSSNYHGQRL